MNAHPPHQRLIRHTQKVILQLHRDQGGAISVASVFAFLFLTMVLGMVINIGRHADRKVKLQSAADAVTYTGTAVTARSMNTLAFTNHLLCDVFALTAYLREARDQNARELYSPVLDEWNQVAPKFLTAPEEPMSRLMSGIPQKTPMERQMVEVFSTFNSNVSMNLLPVMEQILSEELIPKFQRALVAATPGLANEAANEVASRHGPSDRGLNQGTEMAGLMWRTDGEPFGFATYDGDSQLPVADPVNDDSQYSSYYLRTAIDQRRQRANRYLEILNNLMLRRFDDPISSPQDDMIGVAKMSQFGNLWRGFTRGYLDQLLNEEYPESNLVYQIRRESYQNSDPNRWIQEDYMFVGVTYWTQMEEHMPGLFRNPMDSDSSAFAQAQMFIPRKRIMRDLRRSHLPEPYWWVRVGGPQHRDLMNQNWSVKLVPATASVIPSILQTDPPQLEFNAPNLRGVTVEDFRRINMH